MIDDKCKSEKPSFELASHDEGEPPTLQCGISMSPPTRTSLFPGMIFSRFKHPSNHLSSNAERGCLKLSQALIRFNVLRFIKYGSVISKSSSWPEDKPPLTPLCRGN